MEVFIFPLLLLNKVGGFVLKVEKKWCSECCERTNHNYVGSKGDFEGLGIARAILAVSSLGISETVCRDKYWQCCKCGEVSKG